MTIDAKAELFPTLRGPGRLLRLPIAGTPAAPGC